MFGIKLLSTITLLAGVILGTNITVNSEVGSDVEYIGSTSDSDTSDPQKIYKQSCGGCHGQNLEGIVGPSLSEVGSKYSKDEIAAIIRDGKEAMPPGLLTDETDISILAEWLSELKTK
ncbi:c-type cytochrome [Brevibacillus sp. SYSU BS000544]|uniref:c-type cytochrome n=1 Tax=Brevibacillus sp. SYSU BS000544 TaxID=3416443 RepID=UPI003CE488C7